jgi:hypothetical protein
MDAKRITDAVMRVTGDWAKQRKAEERERSRVYRRREALIRYRRITVKDAAYHVMSDAYLKASANGRLPAHARQIMYAARGSVQELSGRQLDDQYFTQTLLPDYMNDYPDETKDWDVVFDARGHFLEPHTDKNIPLGTLNVRHYLNEISTTQSPGITDGIEDSRADTFPTCGPNHRFSAVLFIEKEGFMPLFQRVKLAERYDIAIMSTKGMSVTASRLLVDHLCKDGVKLLVLHDFDKAGFSICATLQRDTRRYEFINAIEVVDLGLRLADVQEYDLESEEVSYGKSDPTYNLRENGATSEEIRFLYKGGNYSLGPYGNRVELNAFTSDKLIEWIERKLKQHGVEKVVPTKEVLELAYRRAVAINFLKSKQQELLEEAEAEALERDGTAGSRA